MLGLQRHIFNCSNGCPVESTLQIISGKWKSVILYHLIKNKVCRFSELQKKNAELLSQDVIATT